MSVEVAPCASLIRLVYLKLAERTAEARVRWSRGECRFMHTTWHTCTGDITEFGVRVEKTDKPKANLDLASLVKESCGFINWDSFLGGGFGREGEVEGAVQALWPG